MSVLLAQPVGTLRASHPELVARGYTGYTISPMSVLNPLGIPLRVQEAYAEYEAHIAIFIGATMLGKKLSLTTKALNVPPKFPVFPLTYPPVVWSCINLTDDRRKKIELKYKDNLPEYQEIGKDKRFVFHKPSTQLHEDLSELCGPVGPIPSTHVHIDALPTLKWVAQVLAGFLSTHTYAAFENTEKSLFVQEDEDDDTEKSAEETVETVQEFINHRFAEGQLDQKAQYEKALYDNAVKRIDVFQKVVAQENWNTQDGVQAVISTLEANYLAALTRQHTVLYASPSSERPAHSCGPVVNHPKTSRGMFFPYIRGTISQDSRTLPTILLRRFCRLLGKDFHDVAQNIKSTRKYLAQIASTELGNELTHLFTGIDLAISAQARIYVIREGGQYMGFSLLGSYFCVQIADSIYIPRKPATVKAALAKVSTNDHALSQCAALLSDIPLKKDKEEDPDITEKVTSEQVSDPRLVIAALAKRDIEPKVLSDFKKNYAGVTHTKRYRPLTAAGFLETLRLMQDPSGEAAKAMVSKHLLYISDAPAAQDSDLGLLLSTHGPEIFAPRSSSGMVVNVGQKCTFKETVFEGPRGKAQRKRQVDVVGIKPEDRLEKILLAKIATDKGIKQWKDFITTGDMFFNPAQRSQGSSGLSLTGKFALDYQLELAELSKDRVEKTKKRKRDDTDSAESELKKAKLVDNFFDGI